MVEVNVPNVITIGLLSLLFVALVKFALIKAGKTDWAAMV